jgi:hypothetical protein
MGKSYTKIQLEAMTVAELREMCVYELGIRGLTKKPKAVIIDAIIDSYNPKGTSTFTKSEITRAPITGVEGTFQSSLTKPDAPFGSKTSTTIQVSSGASSGRFPVVNRTVAEVGEFLREVLNVDKLSTGLVNGKEVEGSYVLKAGDVLEFLKPAGRKGL